MTFSQSSLLSVVFVTRSVLQGMDEIVREMRVERGDGPIPPKGYVLRAGDIGINIYSDDSRGNRFTYSVAATVLHGIWELLAQYGFFTVAMEIFLDSLDGDNHIGEISVLRTIRNGTVTTEVPVATDTRAQL